MALVPSSRRIAVALLSLSWAAASGAEGPGSAPEVTAEAPAALAPSQAQPLPPVPPAFRVTLDFGKGLSVARLDDALSLNLKGRVVVRDVLANASGATTNEFAIRTVRLTLSGKALAPHLTYLVQLAFGTADYESLGNVPNAASTSSSSAATSVASPVFDAYLDYAPLRDLHLKVGQYFVPFDRARTIRESALQFVDRQQVISEMTLDRDIGLTAYSDDLLGLGGRLAYAVGFFGGQGKNRVAAVKNPVFLWTARVTARPFGPFDDDSEGDLERLPKPRLAVGLAAAYNGNTPRQKSTTGNIFTLHNADYLHLAADVVLKWAGLSFLGEAVLRQASWDMREGVSGATAIREYTRSGWGYTLQAGYMAMPMLEVVARWNQLRALGDTDPSLIKTVSAQGRELTIGLNLYMNRHLFKLQADYTARFAQSGAVASHLVRALVDLSI